MSNLESGIWNQESGIWNLESGIWNLESGILTLQGIQISNKHLNRLEALFIKELYIGKTLILFPVIEVKEVSVIMSCDTVFLIFSEINLMF